MKKSVLIAILLMLVFISVVFFGGLIWWKGNISAVSDNDETVSFVIPKGYFATQVASKLYEQNLIKSPLVFKIYVQISGKSRNINAGEFRLNRNMTLQEIVDALGRGPLELWVTVPEGLRREEILVKFIEGLEINSEQSKIFADEFLKSSSGKEGYLFPDTYLFPRDVSADVVVSKMIDNFNSKIDNEMLAKIEQGNHTLEEYVTMASIIERETKTDEERPIVAGILWKRLETQGWLLQADATLQYELGSRYCRGKVIGCDDWWPVLTRNDLEIVSPYNSYMVDDLPPAPISNPGLSSLKASMFPKNTEYWFYIHDSNSDIHYGKDIDEHNRNIRQYLGK